MIDSCLGKIACAESAHSNRDRLPVASGAEPLFSYTTHTLSVGLSLIKITNKRQQQYYFFCFVNTF